PAWGTAVDPATGAPVHIPSTAPRPWVSFGEGGLNLSMGFHFDNLTAVMVVVVTLISALVHLYSTGYMHEDPKYSRYFAYLSWFTFAMLGLVLCDNLLALYMFWELVGVGSYLLIGFWFEKGSAANAAKKAFVVNRVGDVGFFVGILILWTQVGELNYTRLFEELPLALADGRISPSLLTIAGVCLFCGAIGKSAQFPLHVWLPDAMEGPTPVSALIHAATMVAAGVYMVGRLFPIFTPDALLVVTAVGTFTAVIAATIALVQNDIKKVLAYSTVSQLGYMIAALGIGAYTAGLLHLVTHAAFKACMFLGSGSVIHATHTQDIRKMGGLWRKMPLTALTFATATLSICGVVFFSGYYSKDWILKESLLYGMTGHHPAVWLVPAALFGTAGMTAFYMVRLYALTFLGRPRDPHAYDHAHESPPVMTMPLVLLAVLSFAFWFEIPLTAGHGPEAHAPQGHAIEGWFAYLNPEPVSLAVPVGAHRAPRHGEGLEMEHKAHEWTMLGATALVYPAIALALFLYLKGQGIVAGLARAFAPLHRFLENKWYIDELYAATWVRALLAWNRLCALFDKHVIDGVVNALGETLKRSATASGVVDNAIVDGAVRGVGAWTVFTGAVLRLVQTGRIQTYLFVLLGGVILILGFQLVGWGA
ncbi:MAG: NADH-quinone oxidoreductase subunit L, partial [Planctomycetes bacterium]|nr:NADH-quinone oxidoreductase subunit L [Planctomycetota bacterium]